jgi:uncharacterized protein YraI
MNTVTTPVGRLHQQHPPSSTLPAPRRVQRVALIDRLALRLGVALVAWSRRPRVLDDRDERARRVQSARAAERRERDLQRDALQLLPLR